MRARARFTLLILAVLYASFSVWASITGSISELVTYPRGSVVAGAQVIAIETHAGIRTNAHGFERVLQLPDIAEAKAGSACEEIRPAGRRTFNVAGDLKGSSKFNKLLEKTIAEFGSIDRLVKNASVILRQNIRWSIRTKESGCT